jgi:hypothetical protein
MPYQLYRHFAADGTLLYVGISRHALTRLGQHDKALWAPLIARVEIEQHATEAAARKAEKWAIVSEAPTFNRQHDTGLSSNIEIGKGLSFTLMEAYEYAAKGERFNTIDPAEFATMTRQQRREHRRALNRIARKSRVLP